MLEQKVERVPVFFASGLVENAGGEVDDESAAPVVELRVLVVDPGKSMDGIPEVSASRRAGAPDRGCRDRGCRDWP